MDANEVLLENLDNVRRLATSFAYRFGYDADDLTQTACLYFLQRWDTRPDSMPVSNFIRCYINYHLIDVTKNGQKKKHVQTSKGVPDITDEEDAHVWSIFDQLSEDASYLLSIFIDAPADIRNKLRETNGHKRSVSIVSSWLRANGWTRDRVTDAFHTLEEACTH